MKKLNSILESKLYFDLRKKLHNSFLFDKIAKTKIEILSCSSSSKRRKLEILFDIINANKTKDENLILNLYDEYFICNEKRRIEIRYGFDKLKEYENKLKKTKNRPNFISQYNKKYWIKKGHSESEAIQIVSDLQKENSSKNDKKYLSKKDKMKHCVKYWLTQGYTNEESELLRQPYLAEMKNGLNDLINRYGEIEGRIKYEKRILKYKNSMNNVFESKKTGGYVSKESLRFFIPLYKKCRKLGINRNDIYLGVNGSREFFIKDENIKEKNTGCFYDFCIPKLKIIIEYNGTFWHPRNPEEWNNPWINFNDAMEKENYRKNLVNQRSFKLIEVWSDDNKEDKMNSIMEIINAVHK